MPTGAGPSAGRLPVYRTDIDGMRGLAVLAVVAYHAFPAWLPGGFIGVDCFFVISGYLITRDLLARRAAERPSIAAFYRRRVHRLLPALLMVLPVCLLVGRFTLFPVEFQSLLVETVASALFLQNIWLWSNTGYFDTAAALRPLLHLWSLAVEEQFYLVWPWLLLSRLNIWRWAAVAAGLSFSAGLVLLRHDPVGAYYLFPARAWQLLAGAMLALAAARQPLQPQRGATPPATASRQALAWAGAGMLLAGLVWARPDRSYPGWMALLPTLAMVLLLVDGPATAVGRLLQQRWLVAVGLISYPLYLWHWPLLAFARIHHAGSPGAGVRVMAVLLAFVLAWATWRFVERQWRPLGGARKTTMLCLAMLAIAAWALAWQHWPPSMRPDDARTELQLRDIGMLHSPQAVAAEACAPGWRQMLPQLSHCLRTGPQPTVNALVGDSHAHHLFPGLEQARPDMGWLLLANSSCPPLLGVHVRLPRLDCADRAEAALRAVAAEPTIARVVLAFLGSYALTSNLAAEHVQAGTGPAQTTMTDRFDPRADKSAAMRNGLLRTVDLLQSAGKQVVIVLDVPEWPFQPRDCIDRPLVGKRIADCSILRTEVLARQAALRQTVADIQANRPGVLVLDPIDTVCGPLHCQLLQHDMLVMRDSHHLSERGSTLVARQLLLQLPQR